MPWTVKQRGLFGSDLGRLKKGQKTETGMSWEELVRSLHEPTRKSVVKKRTKWGMKSRAE